jgi:hypothetical protein
MDVLAGTDFFTVEVLTWRGLITYYILFFIEIGRSPGVAGRHHPIPGLVLDGASGAERDDGRHRIPEPLSVSTA